MQTVLSLLLGAAATGTATGVVAGPLNDYANACARDVGVAVDSFNCMDGTKLEMEGDENGNCAKPPYLDGAGCHANSFIGQQVATKKLAVVYLCRKKKNGLGLHQFDDIAVIETNFETGATCFFQWFDKSDDAPPIDGTHIPAPRTAEGEKFWLKPDDLADPGNACVGCHDNGPFIRTPYVMQAQLDALKNGNRNNDRYWFGGNDYVHWNGKVFKVAVHGTEACTHCHSMGANSIPDGDGTSALFGLQATGALQTPFLNAPEHHAHWMWPGLTEPNALARKASKMYEKCAKDHKAEGCDVKRWPGAAGMDTHHRQRIERTPSNTLSPAPAK